MAFSGFPFSGAAFSSEEASSNAAFSISPTAGHTNGATLTINVTYTGGASAPASGTVPLSIQSGAGSITAGTWVQDSGTTGHFTFVEGAVSGTATVFLDSVTSTTQSFSNAAVAPGKPTAVVATDPHNDTLSIAFSAPADNGGASITSYTATTSSGGFNNSGGSSPIVISGINKGVSQTITVTATNSAGTGSDSDPSSPITPVTVPDAPTAASAVAGNTQATVSFSAPADDGGSTILAYEVTSSPGGIIEYNSSSPVVVTGLTNGVAYTFTVKASNAQGASAASTATNPAVTPSDVVTITDLRLPVTTADNLGTVVAQTLTLSAATVGTGRTATAGGGTPFSVASSPVGKFILEGDVGLGVAIITARTSDTVVTVQIISAFAGTSIASSGWYIWAPSVQLQTFQAGSLDDWGSPITDGFWLASPNVRNSWMLDIAPIPNGDFGDFYGIGVLTVSGTVQAFEVYSPPTIPPDTLKGCFLAPFLESSTMGEPGYQLRAGGTPAGANVGSRVTTGFEAVAGATNLYAVDFEATPDANFGYVVGVDWDTG